MERMNRSALALHLRTEAELNQKLALEYLPTGISVVDHISGGVPRGALTEVFGPATCGKTAFLHTFISRSTQEGEFCALVDATNTFDPGCAVKAGAYLQRLLWVRCIDAVQALKAADLLVHSGGWGVIVLDLGDIPPEIVRKLPISYWYRFRRAVENTPAAFVVLEREPFARNCAAMALEMPSAATHWTGRHQDFRLLRGMNVQVTPRKAMSAQPVSFRAQASA